MSARQVAIATLVILGIVLLAYVLWLTLDVLLLVFIGILVASAIEPLVDRLRRGPFSRGQGVLVVYTLIVGVVALIAALAIPPLLQQLTAFSDDLPRRLDDLRGQTAGVGPRPLRDIATRAVLWAQSSVAASAVEPSTSSGVSRAVVDVGLSVANIVVAVVSIFVIAYYWLVERSSLKRAVLGISGPKHARRVNLIWMAIEARLGAWVRGQLILMAVIGVGLGSGYLALGIPGALPLAVWAAIAEMIPMVGPYLGVAPALLVAFTVSPTTALVLALYAVVIQSIEGYILVPRVMGHAVGVSPLVIFLGILVGEHLGGLPGAFLAVPVAGALQVIMQDLLSSDHDVALEATRLTEGTGLAGIPSGGSLSPVVPTPPVESERGVAARR